MFKIQLFGIFYSLDDFIIKVNIYVHNMYVSS